MGLVLDRYGGPECAATSQFFKMMDEFFDCINLWSLDEYSKRNKPNLAPYRSDNDGRFDWMKNRFLAYFNGRVTLQIKSKMFISWQTYEGIQMTVYSVCEATQFLLREGMEYVLTECFFQDLIEQYFTNNPSVGEVITQIFTILDIMITLTEFEGVFHMIVEIVEEDTKCWVNITDEKLPGNRFFC